RMNDVLAPRRLAVGEAHVVFLHVQQAAPVNGPRFDGVLGEIALGIGCHGKPRAATVNTGSKRCTAPSAAAAGCRAPAWRGRSRSGRTACRVAAGWALCPEAHRST